MLSRREFLSLGLGSGLAGVAGYALGRHAAPVQAQRSGSAAPGAGYAHGIEPPTGIGPLGLDGLVHPPPRRRGLQELDLWVAEQPVEIARGTRMTAWTFNGTVPGPVLRATEGDELNIRFRNLGARAHNLHFHGRHDVTADGWEPVPPGGEARYRFRAGPFGLHPYHCDTTPAAEHISHGLFGAFIVDPPGGRPPAHEIVLVLGGFDTDGDGQSDLYAWNGVAGYFARYPIKVPTGRLVRAYLINMVADQPLASFHLHAETFDIYRSGTRLVPDERSDVVTLAQGERAIVEFRLPARGRYMFHPHQRQMAERGAMGWLAAI